MDITIPEGMSDAALLALVVGFVSPLALNFINKATWPSWVKSLVAFGWSVVLGVATIAVTGAWDGLSIVSTILLILVVSITAYQQFWRQVGLENRGADEKREAEAAAARLERAELVDDAATRAEAYLASHGRDAGGPL